MANIPHHIRQANPNQPPHILQIITQQARMDQAGRNNYYQQQLQRQRQGYYGAIAYSLSTGKWGYSWGHKDRAAADRAALDQCPAPDAEILMWGSDSYIALASGEGGHVGAAGGYDQQAAERLALQTCGHNAQIRVVIHSAWG
jgi:hypothetical protein